MVFTLDWVIRGESFYSLISATCYQEYILGQPRRESFLNSMSHKSNVIESLEKYATVTNSLAVGTRLTSYIKDNYNKDVG